MHDSERIPVYDFDCRTRCRCRNGNDAASKIIPKEPIDNGVPAMVTAGPHSDGTVPAIEKPDGPRVRDEPLIVTTGDEMISAENINV